MEFERPTEVTAEDIAAAEAEAYEWKDEFENWVHFACVRCGADLSTMCGIINLQIPIGKDKFGRIMMALQSSIEHPLICPRCGRSQARKPSKILPGGMLPGVTSA